MPSAEGSVTIDRPVDEVFAFLSDHENDARWRPAVKDIERVSGAPGAAGSVYRQGAKGPFGRRVPADFEVTQVEPGRLIAFRTIAGPVRPEGRYELEPAGERSTRVRLALSAELGGAKRLMSPMVGQAMKSEVGNLERLKSVLESSA